jgi:DNA-binding NtrC family response regulator
LPRRQEKRRTILHFGSDHTVLNSRGQFLNDLGYRILNLSNGFEALRLSTSKRVHAVVLDLDHNHEDVMLIAQEIKRRRPEVPTIVLAEASGPVDGLQKHADALVPKEDSHDTLVRSLQKLLTQ